MTTSFDAHHFRQWLEYNSSPYEEPLVLDSASTPPVITNGALVGSNANAALALDDQYTSASGTDRLNKLQQSPATGCAKIITLARIKSGYEPATPAAAGSAQQFLSFVQQILVCPIFSTIINDHVSPSYSGSWASVISQIASYYNGLSVGDVEAIEKSLERIAAAASSNPSTNESYNVFVQSTINAGSDLDVYMYRTHVQMMTTVHHGGKHEPDTVSNQANMSLYRVHLRFNSAAWPSQAASVEAQSNQSLRGWLEDMSTPQGSLQANWGPS